MDICPALQECKVLLSRHDKCPVQSVIGWRRAAAQCRALFEGWGSNDLSSLRGLQWLRTLPLRYCFKIRPASVTDAREEGSQALVMLEDWDWTGPLTRLVKGGVCWKGGITGSPIARRPPLTSSHHVGSWFPVAQGWLSAWQSLVHLQPVTMILPGSELF